MSPSVHTCGDIFFCRPSSSRPASSPNRVSKSPAEETVVLGAYERAGSYRIRQARLCQRRRTSLYGNRQLSVSRPGSAGATDRARPTDYPRLAGAARPRVPGPALPGSRSNRRPPDARAIDRPPTTTRGRWVGCATLLGWVSVELSGRDGRRRRDVAHDDCLSVDPLRSPVAHSAR